MKVCVYVERELFTLKSKEGPVPVSASVTSNAPVRGDPFAFPSTTAFGKVFKISAFAR
jgi:hypothetical protein